jgi:hypothetical protein
MNDALIRMMAEEAGMIFRDGGKIFATPEHEGVSEDSIKRFVMIIRMVEKAHIANICDEIASYAMEKHVNGESEEIAKKAMFAMATEIAVALRGEFEE